MIRSRTLMLVLVSIAGVAMADTKVTFDQVGPLPASWMSGITGTGAAKWDVVADGSAPSSPRTGSA